MKGSRLFIPFRKPTRKQWVKAFISFVAMLAITAALDSFLGIVPEGVATAALMGALLTGAGVSTTFQGQAQLEQYIVVGDVDTANPLQGIYISVDGDTKIDIQTAGLVDAFSKLYMQWSGTVIGLMFRVATARIKGNTTYRLTNAGATTPNIYAYSIGEDEPAPVLAQTVTINASSNQTFTEFSALLVVNTNVASFDMTWNDTKSSTQNMSVVEVDGLMAAQNSTQADGRYNATTTSIDNADQKYKSVKINTGAGGSVTVCIIKVPDGYFRMQYQKAAK